MTVDLFDEPSDTREEILAATYRALRRHGYAELTIQRIGDEFEKSQSLIYHHYEDKDDLVLACLEFMLERFQTEFVDAEIEAPRAALETTIDLLLVTDPDPDRLAFHRTLVDLRAQVSHDPTFAEHFARSDRLFQDRLAAILAAGVDRGTFQALDPDRVATLLFTTITGAFYRDATSDDRAWVDDLREELDEYLEMRVYA